MRRRNTPIQQKLMKVIMLTSGAVLLLTCASFFAYELVTFRQSSIRQLSTLGEIIATNSTAALAFDDSTAANEILSALKAERHVVAACLYDADGKLFSSYRANAQQGAFPAAPETDGYQFTDAYFGGYQSVVQGDKRLGTLYLKSDTGAMYERLRLYGSIAVLVVALSFLLAYLLSKNLQHGITTPILALAETAKAISDRQDYSVRAVKQVDNEVGVLTDAFNQMLTRIQEQNLALNESSAKIVAFNQRLEQRVAERTAELEASNKELESFSYSVSHDLRAPIRSIHGYANILQEEYASVLDVEAIRLIHTILRNSKRMGQLIDDLLAFSRLGRKELMRFEISVQDIVHTVVEEYKIIEGDRPMEIKIEKLPNAFADLTTLRQVWINLVSNALKYSRDRERSVVEIGSFEKDHALVYYIKDNGAGFDMKYYDKLFGVFQRLHSQREFEGTGVGLAIVQRIIARHGGRIWAEAKLNEGATFYFTLNAMSSSSATIGES
ncbi:MAG TPA: ATP-binding protein [Chryseolinea sp.]